MAGLHIKLDVSYHQDPKVLDLDDERAELLFVRGLTYCKQHLTDGVIHRRAIGSFAPFIDDITPADLAAELVRVGLWREHPKGWIVPAWLDHNKPAEEVMTSAKGREMAHKRHHVKKGIVSPDCDLCRDTNPQVVTGGCQDDAGGNADRQCAEALPETETETYLPDSQSDLPPDPPDPDPSAVEVDPEQTFLAAVAAVAKLEAGDITDGAYRAGIRKEILQGPDPERRDRIRALLAEHRTPEAVAEHWPTPAADPLADLVGRRRSAAETDEATQAEILERAHRAEAESRARADETRTAPRADPAVAKQLIDGIRASRRAPDPEPQEARA